MNNKIKQEWTEMKILFRCIPATVVSLFVVYLPAHGNRQLVKAGGSKLGGDEIVKIGLIGIILKIPVAAERLEKLALGAVVSRCARLACVRNEIRSRLFTVYVKMLERFMIIKIEIHFNTSLSNRAVRIPPY